VRGEVDRPSHGKRCPRGRVWCVFGEQDGYNLWEATDNVYMAAVAVAISGGGALSSFETTVLLSVDETLDVLRKAEEVGYRAPGS
jgi:uncharacterized protein with GYD domain